MVLYKDIEKIKNLYVLYDEWWLGGGGEEEEEEEIP